MERHLIVRGFHTLAGQVLEADKGEQYTGNTQVFKHENLYYEGSETKLYLAGLSNKIL